MTGGVTNVAVFEHEQVLGRALGDVAVDGQHDRLVKPRLDRLGLRERRLRVRAGDLRSRGQRLVRHAPPRADHAADARLDLDVVAERNRVDEEAVLEVVEANADLFAGRVQKRTDVDVRLELVAAQQLEREVDQLLGRVRKRHAHDVGRAAHALVVLGRLEQVELLLLRVPVGADAFEDTGAVVQRMGHQAEPHVVVAAELAVVRRPRCWGEARAFLVAAFGLRFHTHLELSVGAPARSSAPGICYESRTVTLYGIIADLRREHPTPGCHADPGPGRGRARPAPGTT